MAMCVNQNIAKEVQTTEIGHLGVGGIMGVKGREGTIRSEECCKLLRLLLLFCVIFLVIIVADIVVLLPVGLWESEGHRQV